MFSNVQTKPFTRSFDQIILKRRKICEGKQHSQLKQGTTFPIANISPYSFYETLRYGLRFLTGVENRKECDDVAPIGQLKSNHAVGVRSATINYIYSATTEASAASSSSSSSASLKILFVGDVMLSGSSAKTIKIDSSWSDLIKTADVCVMNVESPVFFQITPKAREGLSFSMPSSYIAEMIQQFKVMNPKIQFIYNLANNHALDGFEIDIEKLTREELELHRLDPDNFILLRSVAAIRKVDPDALITGVHFSEEKYRKYGVDVNELAIVVKDDIRIGILGFTDILNHNQYHLDKRVYRFEDIPNDLNTLKAAYHLDYLYTFGHGDFEHKHFVSKHWRDLSISLLNRGADGTIGHGPHVPQTTEILMLNNTPKLMCHSLGNFYGPTKLDRTSIGGVCALDIEKTRVRYEMKALQATEHESTGPQVEILTGSNPIIYPDAYKQFRDLYPISSLNVEYRSAADLAHGKRIFK